jgi:hypothetical protein
MVDMYGFSAVWWWNDTQNFALVLGGDLAL